MRPGPTGAPASWSRVSPTATSVSSRRRRSAPIRSAAELEVALAHGQKRRGHGRGRRLFPDRPGAAAAPHPDRRGPYLPGARADGPDRRPRRDHHRSSHRLRHARTVPRDAGHRRMAGRASQSARRPTATPRSACSRTIRRSTTPRSRSRSEASASTSARSDRRRRTRDGSSGCAREASKRRRSRASTRRSASTSAPSARPRSRFRSSARSSPRCARSRSARKVLRR